MRFAYYKAPTLFRFQAFRNSILVPVQLARPIDGPTYVDWAVNQFSGRGGYSHVEIVFSDGLFFSASPREGVVRYKRISPDLRNWDFVDFPVSLEQEHEIRAWCDTQVGKKYDWAGVFGFVWDCRDDPDEWFCSKICGQAPKSVGIWTKVETWRLSPNGHKQLALGRLT